MKEDTNILEALIGFAVIIIFVWATNPSPSEGYIRSSVASLKHDEFLSISDYSCIKHDWLSFRCFITYSGVSTSGLRRSEVYEFTPDKSFFPDTYKGFPPGYDNETILEKMTDNRVDKNSVSSVFIASVRMSVSLLAGDRVWLIQGPIFR